VLHTEKLYLNIICMDCPGPSIDKAFRFDHPNYFFIADNQPFANRVTYPDVAE
jgi:hypothetical protein